MIYWEVILLAAADRHSVFKIRILLKLRSCHYNISYIGYFLCSTDSLKTILKNSYQNSSQTTMILSVQIFTLV